jgi:hypothetical protein
VDAIFIRMVVEQKQNKPNFRCAPKPKKKNKFLASYTTTKTKIEISTTYNRIWSINYLTYMIA